MFVHGLHGVQWSYLKVQMERDHPTPTAALWDSVHYACDDVKEVDFSLYVSCAHGLGHSLVFYVSSGRANVSDAVAVCAHAAPDSRVALSCADGFYHELERAAIFLDPAKGMHFLPNGVRAPCDHDGLHTFHYECFLHLKLSSSQHRKLVIKHSWIDLSTLPDGKSLVSLTAEGKRVWRESSAFCAATSLYRSLYQQTACLTFFAQWFSEFLQDQAPGGSLYDASGFALGAEERVGHTEPSGMPPPQVRGETVANSSADTRYVSTNDMPYLLCEQATGLFWAWLPCSTRASNHWGLAIDTDETSNSVQYSTAGARWHEDPLVPIGEGKESGLVSSCNETWTMERFLPSDDLRMQVAFGLDLCVERARSHGYNLVTMQGPALLADAYAAFQRAGVPADGEPSRAKRSSVKLAIALVEPAGP